MKIKAWLNAARLRTLPLSVSGIIVGSGLAAVLDKWDGRIFALAMLTTIGFQVISNFANDLGDSQKGTDNEHRVGPKRTIQAGLLTQVEMKRGIFLAGLISAFSAILLIFISSKNLTSQSLFFYLILAGLCILAAITYTVGKNAYGYRGLGDVMVFIFFGLVSVLGVFQLYGLSFEWLALFPAITIGLWSTAVLNLNNLRDIENDRKSKKNTLVVQLGFKKGKFYHAFLIITGALTWWTTVFSLAGISYNPFLLLSLIPSVFLFIHLKKVFLTSVPANLDSELKKVALLTFFSSVIFAVILNY
ncbi:MAG: 1,4-dihydroxy-2-naphthoate octaprenyltransferase [Bacteroidota bacterium]|jgi:1,4-dihydroxy-2-naphthoate octaprenyltransferase